MSKNISSRAAQKKKALTPYRKFKPGTWQKAVDVSNFIKKNYSVYNGDESFLVKPTKKTVKVWGKTKQLLGKELKKGGLLGVDTKTVSTITSHKPGYIDQKNESIVGVQADKPLVRTLKAHGGIRLVERSLEDLGYKISPEIHKIYTEDVTTHNDAVFDMYYSWDDFFTADKNLFRKEGLITGLPDNYSRGRIIGDYRRVALYGIDRLVEERKAAENKKFDYMNEENMRARTFLHKQIRALEDMKKMAASYGFDVGKPARDTKEAIQWLYFGYLAAVKEQDGAAMSMGRIDAFIDIYAERDLRDGRYGEDEIQQFVDDFVIKLRIVRHLRHPEYNALFAGDPTWITCVLGGMTAVGPRGKAGKSMVTKTSFRMLHTLENLGPAPEPNLTVLWSQDLPEGFKDYSSRIAIESSSLQFENDDLMRPYHGDDYGIACCVSAMAIGKEMQFFGARCNLPKLLLLAINQGRNELTGGLVLDGVKPLKNRAVLDYKEVSTRFFGMMDWLAKKYVETMNVIHYSHDNYHYENSQMALHDIDIHRFMAFGMAGMSIVADSLSAIKHAKVRPTWDKKTGIAKDFKIVGSWPAFGNNDARVDSIAVELCKKFTKSLRKYPTYKDAEHSLSLLTITANVVYGKHTGATPDGRKAHEPFAPGANPMHNRDKCGALASLNSVAKLPYNFCRDGISNTFSITPQTLGKNEEMRIENLSNMLDGYFKKGGHHINVNVLNREVLEDAMKKPWKYPQLTIRVSGYAVNFIKLTKEQQKEVISRTFHKKFY
ncbi:formate C-acetyltransferase [Candidatus Peregrinibacteria bacterium]|jgi:formate C-acetyltransferase|nr:formate C-acetyltransferase [Candidatus Peregrinibacteria bacterium]MBT4148532.1 formate C-acetyltransferase [Candidatus Peregrinibacteria bacterium]MBT4366499.1 formate C-acetyltransferase [Candidatus Peregrinibacteria bacterium]MBT4456156.1 formate C-acetyltransferase [Candidatus Peregrinibacteria bacterium]